MIRITNTFRRPTTDIPFHSVNMTTELFEYIKTTYKDTGKLVHIQVVNSDDLLTMVATWVWNTQEDYMAYQEDPVIKQWFTTITSHNESNGITHVSKLKENVDTI